MRHIILWQKNKGSCGYDGLATIHLFLEPNTAIIYASYFSEYFYYSRYDSLHLTIYWCIWLLSRSIFDSLCVLKFLVLSCHHYPSPAKHVEHRTYHMQISFYNLGFFFFLVHVPRRKYGGAGLSYRYNKNPHPRFVWPLQSSEHTLQGNCSRH